jgi:CheY-like chemotaxis protein
LLIDDDTLLRSTVRQFLERAGHSVSEARDGRAGVASLRAHPADVVVTDIIMPDQEGMETISQIVEFYPDVPIIAVSGGSEKGMGSYLETAKALGCFATLKKPFTRQDLLAAVEAAGQARAGHALSRPWD